MTTLEGNKLIAEFDGWIKYEGRKIEDDLYTHQQRNITFYHRANTNFKLHFKYHSSWDWLMPVVEKIHDECKLYSEGLKFFEGLTVFSTIQQVYDVVIQFILWYNSQSTKQ